MKNQLYKKTFYFILLLFIILQSCNSQDKNGNTKPRIMNQPFDLATLTLNENINDIMSSTQTTLKDTLKVDDWTYIGNERLALSKKKLLVFNGTIFFNEDNKARNQVIFHYGKVDKDSEPFNNEKNDILGMYQLNLFSKKDGKSLIDNLENKLGKVAYTNEKEGFISDIVDNNLTPTKDKFHSEVFIWRNNGLIYYFFTSEVENKPTEYFCKLYVFKFNHKEWVSLLSTLSYPELSRISTL